MGDATKVNRGSRGAAGDRGRRPPRGSASSLVLPVLVVQHEVHLLGRQPDVAFVGDPAAAVAEIVARTRGLEAVAVVLVDLVAQHPEVLAAQNLSSAWHRA